MISQLTVFLQNEKGHLSRLCNRIAEAGINMHAMFLSDTSDFGIVRIFCDQPEQTCRMLADSGFRASLTPVNAVKVPNEPGGLAKLLKVCESHDFNIEYGYCFKAGNDEAIDVLKINGEQVDQTLHEAGFTIVAPEEIYVAN